VHERDIITRNQAERTITLPVSPRPVRAFGGEVSVRYERPRLGLIEDAPRILAWAGPGGFIGGAVGTLTAANPVSGGALGGLIGLAALGLWATWRLSPS
jgi:hypothetical protein